MVLDVAMPDLGIRSLHTGLRSGVVFRSFTDIEDVPLLRRRLSATRREIWGAFSAKTRPRRVRPGCNS